jgi:hypothetical protein
VLKNAILEHVTVIWIDRHHRNTFSIACTVKEFLFYIFVFFWFLAKRAQLNVYTRGGSIHSLNGWHHHREVVYTINCDCYYCWMDGTIYAPWPNRDEKEKKGTRRTRCEMPHLGIELTSRHIPFYGVCWMLYMKSIRGHGIASRLARLTVPKKK